MEDILGKLISMNKDIELFIMFRESQLLHRTKAYVALVVEAKKVGIELNSDEPCLPR